MHLTFINRALFLLIAATVFSGARALRAQDLGIDVGKRAPAAIVRTLDGKSVDLGSYVGKTPMFIEFWAVWCPNCRHLEPALIAAQKKYGSRVKFIGVAVAINQTVERVKLYTEKHGLEHQIVFDTEGNAAEAYDAPATSYIVIVDRTGKIVYTGVGGDQNLEAAIRKAL
ncbi:MAG TPA: TlpA disulfide reductase family protein [Anaerolineae bacterium]|nr:TlpA disulfide reductase family protein [Anaerolineae bacterium]